MTIVVNGIQFGFVLALLVGPVFFTIIQTSIEKGFWNGALVAVGVSLSDTLYVTICYFGLFQFLNDEGSRKYMAYIGGVILILFGLYHLLVKSRKSAVAFHAAVETKPLKYILKGFIINGFTPMVLIFWIGTISYTTVNYKYTEGIEFFIFFISLLVTVLSTDILKAFLADRLRRLVTPRFLHLMNITIGIFLIGFGIRLLVMGKSGLLIT